MLSLRSVIRARSEMRVRVHEAADAAWRKLCHNAREIGGADALQKLTNDRRSEFDRIVEYDNQQLIEHLIPTYKDMLNLFQANMWLADQDTRIHFKALVEFIDVWERSLDDSLPIEVFQELDHREENLKPFYNHLEEKILDLQQRLKRRGN